MERNLDVVKEIESLEEGVSRVTNWILGPADSMLNCRYQIGFDVSSSEELRREHEELELECRVRTKGNVTCPKFSQNLVKLFCQTNLLKFFTTIHATIKCTALVNSPLGNLRKLCRTPAQNRQRSQWLFARRSRVPEGLHGLCLQKFCHEIGATEERSHNFAEIFSSGF